MLVFFLTRDFVQFSIILQQLFESYNSMVSIGTVDELCRTVLAWFEQNCTLPALRPGKLNVYLLCVMTGHGETAPVQ